MACATAVARVAQRPAVHELAHHVGPAALVHRVVHADGVWMDDPAGRDGGLQHVLGGLATRVLEHDGDRPTEDDVDSTPDLPAGGVILDVLLKPVAVSEHLSNRGRSDLGQPSPPSGWLQSHPTLTQD
jgi:hypothetical protein